MFGIVGLLGGALKALPYVAIVCAALLAYDRFIDDPAVRREARAGYVTEAAQAALQAELDETRRQKEAADRTAAAWMGRYNVFVTEQEKQDVEDGAAIADLEAKVAAAGDSCKLKPYQLKQLLKRK